ncbi:EAL and HDOD domain-containing protein [Clostridium sp.]|uniref:EAL and HDOD domain-containing protein n=1 Tax=Clostridium sp. TaxID=1506 RepID=UPI0035A1CB5B
MDAFIARQPIFDKYNKIHGYELLFRNNNKENKCIENDGDKATMEVIKNSMFYIGMDKIVQNKIAFINFTENILTSEIFKIFSPKNTVIEILENVEPSNKVLNACKILKENGFKIALDDFILNKEAKKFIKFADIIKIDFRITQGYKRKKIINTINSKKIKFLAEKIETVDEFNESKQYGYTYFQGYYFSKPEIISGKKIPKNKLIYVKLLKEINSKELSIENIENLIRSDISLSYDLLKIVNSAQFYLKNPIKSIRHALIYFGEIKIKKWVNLTCVKAISNDKPEIIMINTLLRAYFAELIFIKSGISENSFSAFLTGMFSLIDIILERPLKEILQELFLPNSVKNALLEEEDNYYSKTLKLIIAYEKEKWDEVACLILNFNLKNKDLINAYFEAINQINLYL